MRFSLLLISIAVAASCTTPAHHVFGRERVEVEEKSVPPAVLHAARQRLRELVSNPGCYAYEVEASREAYFVGFSSPRMPVPAGVTSVTVTAGRGHCGQGIVIAVSRQGKVLGHRYSR